MVSDNIIKSCINKNRSAQEELYKMLSPKIYGICLRYVKNIPDAQDSHQETFIKIFDKMHTYKQQSGASFDSWACKIAVNNSIRLITKKNPLAESFEIEDKLAVSSAENDAISELIDNDWLNLINKLPEAKRIVFNLHVVEGYSHDEIASLLNISAGTSKSQLSKAKQLLRDAYSKTNQNG